MAKKRIPPTHPGDLLRDELEERGISLNKMSRDTRMPMSRISSVVNSKRSVTAETALRLEAYLGISAGYWLRLQASYDLELAKDELWPAIQREVIKAA